MKESQKTLTLIESLQIETQKNLWKKEIQKNSWFFSDIYSKIE